MLIPQVPILPRCYEVGQVAPAWTVGCYRERT